MLTEAQKPKGLEIKSVGELEKSKSWVLNNNLVISQPFKCDGQDNIDFIATAYPGYAGIQHSRGLNENEFLRRDWIIKSINLFVEIEIFGLKSHQQKFKLINCFFSFCKF